MKLTKLVAVISIVLAGSALRSAAVTLIDEEKARAKIVTAQNPPVTVKLAVAELNYHLEKVSNTRLDVVRAGDRPVEGPRVLVGASQATRRMGLNNEDFEKQEYLVRTPDDRTLILMGRDADARADLKYNHPSLWNGFDFFTAVGSCYAVYDFLERECGIRWYLPNTPVYREEVTTVLPEHSTIRASDLHIRRKPWTDYRMMGHPHRNIPRKLYMWDLQNRPAKENRHEIRLNRRNAKLYWLRQRMGGNAFAANHSFHEYFSRFKDSHPEYFALGEDGERHISGNRQLNFGNPDLLDQVVKDILAWHRGNPRDENGRKRMRSVVDDIFGVVPMDGGNWSHDPRSRELIKSEPTRRIGGFNTNRVSRYVFQFVNKVAERVAEEEPDITISTLAYSDYYFPPEGMTFPDNVSVMVCKQQVKARTRTFDRAYYDSLREWRGKVGGMYIWEYFNFPQHRKWNVFPGLVPRRIGRDMTKLRDIGIDGLFLEYNDGKGFGWPGGFLINPAMEHINYYFTLKLLDTQRRNINELLDEYYRRFYGPAAGPMRQFFEKIERTYMNQKIRPDNGRASDLSAEESWLTAYCPPEKLEAFGQLIKRARDRVDGKFPYQQRVELIEKAIYEFMKTSSRRTRFTELEREKPWANEPAEIEKVMPEHMNMATGDAVQGRPFEREGSGVKYVVRNGQAHNLNEHDIRALTDASGPDTPGENVFLQGDADEFVLRCDLGNPPEAGRQLDAIHVWWTRDANQRHRIAVKFAVRDVESGQWREVTGYLKQTEWEGARPGYKVLRIPFPEGEVTGFDAIRMYDASNRFEITPTRFVEVDVFTSPSTNSSVK